MQELFLKIQLQRAVWTALLRQGQLNDAIKSFNDYKNELKEIAVSKKYAEAVEKELKYCDEFFINKAEKLAADYMAKNDWANALICYKYIYVNNPKNTDNIKNYISCLEGVEQYDLALSLAIILLKKEKLPANYKLISKIYEKNKEFKKAIEYYKKFTEISGKKNYDAVDNNTIGCYYFNSYIKKQQNPDDAKSALNYFYKALEFEPSSKIYLKNTILAAMKSKQFDIEQKCWEKYLELGYATKDDEFTYSASCLRNGDIKGWGKYYNSRFEKNEPTIYPKLNKPIWTGNEDISASTLLVHYEQGYGDNFLMFGYMPRLVKIAKKVIYYIQNNAYELFKDNEYNVQVVSQKNTDLNKLEYDYHIPCMSIPIALKLDKTNISVGGGYIKANKVLAEEFKEKFFKTDKLKIAIAFLGIALNKKRDIPFDKLLKLDELENVQFYCFSKDVDDKLLKKFRNNTVINIAKEFNNFADTAAALDNIDIVVSSDNCILNLAGAMGKKTISIYNYHYEFRWYDLTGEDCGWYKSVKPIVNDPYDNWDKSMEKAVLEIKKNLA